MYHFWTRITRTRRDRTTSRTHFNQGTGTVRKGVAIAASLALAMAIVAVPAFNFETSTPAFGAPGNPGVPAAPLDVFKETFGDGTGTSTPMSLRVYPPSGSPVYTASEAWLPRASSSVMEPSERKGRCNGWILNSKTQNPGIQADYGCDPSAGVKMWPQLQAMASALGTFQGMGAGAETNNVLSSASNSVAADQYAQDPGTLIRTNSATTANGGRFFAVSAVFAALNCAKLDSSSGGWVDPQESFYLIFNGTRQLLTPTPLNPCATGTSSTITEYHPSFPGVVTGTHTVYMDRLSSNAFLLGTPAETFQLGFELYNATATGKGNDVAFDSLAIIDVTPQLDQAFTPAVVPIGVSSNWVFTITNTTDLQAKAGWAYTVPIPAGLTVGTATTNTCSATIAASTSLTITNGTLAKGATSCQIIIPVTPTLNDTYTSQASSITNLGVNPPANTTLKTTELTLDVSVNPTALTAANQTATFSFEVTNTGVVEVKDLQVTAPTTLASGTLGAISCPVTILAAGATTTCTATYTSAQGDITRTYVDVTGKATAKADEATVRTESETDTARVSVLGTSSISITASDPGSMTTVGEVKTFTFTVENTGQTTLDTVQILIDDFDGTGTPPVFTCVSTSLAPGASTTCSGTYIVTALDIASKLITLDAVATSKNAGGDDVVSDQAREQVPYAKGTPDPTKSSLAVSHTNRVVGEPDVATATIVDANNVPLDGITVTFALTGSGTFGSADATRVPTATCVTNTQGQCSVTFTDPKAEVCDVSATVVVAGTPTQITNSPISVTFTAGPFSYATSEFTVTPIATVGNPATYLVVSDGSVYYTGKLTPKDQYGNIITGLNQADVEFLASSTDVTEANFTPNPDGTFTVQYSSKLADSAPTASVTYQGLPVGTTKPIPFKAGDPDPDPNVEVDCPAGAVGTNMSVSPARVMVPGSSTVTVYVTDQFCNPVEDAVVDLYLVPGSSAQLGSSQVTTGSTGHASTTVSDTAPEIVRINGSVTNGPLAGPIQNSPVSVEFYDGDEPAAPVITGPGDGDVTNDNTPEITGTGDEPGNEITVTDEDGDVLCTAVVQEDLSWSCTSTKELEDGDHTITATE
ncbi:MAG: Ig-like domain-containing protein, partial [Propionibacteriaceae bacterium]|nr:Ig-like domain-containing protein [Propionibacteriaceae bacterium]